MPIEVIMPKIDMDMSHGRIMTWHVAEGEPVTQGAPLFDIETDKAAMEIEAPATGTLHHRVAEDTEVAIGEPVAWLYQEGETVGAPPAATAPPPSNPPPTPIAAPAKPIPEPRVTETTSEAPIAGTRATPKARHLARAAGLDLAAIQGSGPGNRIQAEDVQQHVPLAAPVAVPAETGPLAVTRSKGGTGTPILLIHGFAGDATGWAPLETHLRHRPVIRIDLPGHGKSPRRCPARFADLAAELRRALDGLDLPASHVIGHSLGGALALVLADTRPRATASLTLIAPAGLGPEVHGAALLGLCRATRAESLAPWLKTLVGDPAMITDSFARVAMAARTDPELRHTQTAMADALFPDGTQGFDLTGALDRVTAPMRVIWGKADQILPWRHALRVPGTAALHLFEGLGHMPHLEDPEMVGKLIAGPL